MDENKFVEKWDKLVKKHRPYVCILINPGCSLFADCYEIGANDEVYLKYTSELIGIVKLKEIKEVY